MTSSELIGLLKNPDVRAEVQRALGIPSEPVAEALAKLGQAQLQTEARLTDLAIEVKKLAAEVKGLAAAQKRTDAALAALSAEVKELAAEVKDLAAAQKRTEQALGDLTADVRELAAAQKRTEQGLGDLRRAVGALSDNVGFGLEELAAIVLPGVLEREDGVRVERFARRFVATATGEEEVDLFAEGERAGGLVTIVGEVKSRIYVGDVQRFAAKAGRVAVALPAASLPLMFGFVVHPAAREAAAALGVRVVASRPG